MSPKRLNSLSPYHPAQLLWPVMWFALLAIMVLAMPFAEGLFRWMAPDARQVIYQRAGFTQLLGRHLLVVGVAALITVFAGVLAGVVVTRQW